MTQLLEAQQLRAVLLYMLQFLLANTDKQVRSRVGMYVMAIFCIRFSAFLHTAPFAYWYCGARVFCLLSSIETFIVACVVTSG